MNNKKKRYFELLGTVILVLIVSSIAQSISGLNDNWSLVRFIVFIFATYIIFLILKKLIKLFQKK